MKKFLVAAGVGCVVLALALFGLKTFNPGAYAKLLGPIWIRYMVRKMEAERKQLATVTAADASEYMAIITQLEAQFDSFKPQIDAKPLSTVEEFNKGQEETKKLYPELAEKMLNTNLRQAIFLSDKHVLVSFDYLSDKGWIVGAAVFSYQKTKDGYTFSLVKNMPHSFLSLNDWYQLLVETKATTYDLPNFDKRAFVLGGPAFLNQAFASPAPTNLAQYYTWNEVAFNPFLDGLIEEKPSEDNSIYFGFYDDRYAFFMTSPYIRKQNNLNDNEGILAVIDAKGESKFTAPFSALANQQWLLSFPNNELIDIQSYGWSPTHFLLTVRMSYEDGKEKGVVDRQIKFDTAELRSEFGEAVWVSDWDE